MIQLSRPGPASGFVGLTSAPLHDFLHERAENPLTPCCAPSQHPLFKAFRPGVPPVDYPERQRFVLLLLGPRIPKVASGAFRLALCSLEGYRKAPMKTRVLQGWGVGVWAAGDICPADRVCGGLAN